MNSIYIRKRTMRSGRVYLYLQYYPPIRNPRTNKAIRWEALKLEMFPNPKTTFEREHNKSMIEMAEIIKSKRMMLIAGESYGFIDKTRKREDAIRYFEQVCKQKGGKWGAALLHFKEFMGGSCRFEELTEELCEKYKEWILNSENNNKEGAKLKRNSAAAYFSLFRAMLKIAYREHWLTKNLNDFITPIKTVKVSKPYLTLEELRTLADTPCENDVLKRASLFSCLTGLRISDIKTLRWEDLIKNQYGCYTIHKTIVKTGEIADNPISNEARSYCGRRKKGIIFKGLKREMLYNDLPKWISDAGITKHITFHCFRHTYATLQIAAGSDIYTVSKMLNHSNVQTTQIYAELVGEKKVETISRISLKDKTIKK